MKKFIIYIIVFFAIVAAVDFVFGKTCDHMTIHAKSGATKQLVDLCKKNHYDMLVMGSSKAHHNYIPQVFTDSLGLTCYNAGFDGNGIILAYGILSMIDEDCLPKLIVYDVKQQFDIYHYVGDGDYTRYYQTLKKFINKPAVTEIVESISKPDVMKLQSGLVRYNGELVGTISGFLKKGRNDPNNGYSPLYGQLSDNSVQKKDYIEQLDSIKICYLNKFIKLTKEKNIDLIFVFSPEYKSPYAKDFHPVQEICNAEGVPVIDLFENETYQSIELFVDHCHLNESGAKLLSRSVAKEINSIITNNN